MTILHCFWQAIKKWVVIQVPTISMKYLILSKPAHGAASFLHPHPHIPNYYKFMREKILIKGTILGQFCYQNKTLTQTTETIRTALQIVSSEAQNQNMISSVICGRPQSLWKLKSGIINCKKLLKKKMCWILVNEYILLNTDLGNLPVREFSWRPWRRVDPLHGSNLISIRHLLFTVIAVRLLKL